MSTATAPRTEFSELADAAVAGFEAAGLDADSCGDALRRIRRVRGWLDSVEAQVTRRLDNLHEHGQASPAADEHTRCSGTSAAEAGRRERRSKTLTEAPSFDEHLATGDITSARSTPDAPRPVAPTTTLF
ncbi:MAG: hypothetical protein ABIP17_15680 [Ilumatobacteraceae bacterium]